MPFTPTHVAAVLPALPWLRRFGPAAAPTSALVIGSMIPDTAVFLPRFFDYGRAHSGPGLLTVDLPLGLAAFLTWEFLLKASLADLAPVAVRCRLAVGRGPARLSPRTLLTAAAFVLIGAVTHVLWDSFTHAGRWGVRTVPVLQEVWFTLPEWAPTRDPLVRGYRAGQYGSTVLLLPVVAGYAARRLWRAPPDAGERSDVPPAVRGAVVAALFLLPISAGTWEFLRTLPHAPLRVAAVRAVTAAGVWAAAGVTAWAVGHRLAFAERVPADPPPASK